MGRLSVLELAGLGLTGLGGGTGVGGTGVGGTGEVEGHVLANIFWVQIC